jgi:hypothetical protein
MISYYYSEEASLISQKLKRISEKDNMIGYQEISQVEKISEIFQIVELILPKACYCDQRLDSINMYIKYHFHTQVCLTGVSGIEFEMIRTNHFYYEPL